MLSILTLMENQPSKQKALRCEHGLSFLVEAGGLRFVFDCSASDAAVANAHRLGADVRNVDFTVMSHAHFDHGGGYREFVERGLGGKVLYTGAGFWTKKYQVFDGGLKFCDLSAGFDEAFLHAHGIVHRVIDDVTKLADGLWLLGNFPRVHAFETIPDYFVRGVPPTVEADDFSDEICLAADSSKGLIVLVGCSHPGIVNMIEKIHKALGKKIYAVLGGTHLAVADEARIDRTVELLGDMGVEILGFCHCSGKLAEERLEKDPRVRACHLSPGDVFAID